MVEVGTTFGVVHLQQVALPVGDVLLRCDVIL